MDPFISGINRGGGKQKRGRWVFAFVLLLQIAVVGTYFYYHQAHTAKSASRPAASTPAPSEPAPVPVAPVASTPPSAPTPAPPAPAPAPLAAETLAKARAALQADNLLEARALLEQLAANHPADETLKLLGDLNVKMLNSPIPMPGKDYYVVQSGDTLGKIARDCNCTVELLRKMNGMSSDVIRLGERIMIFTGTFSIKVVKSTNTLDLLLNGKLFKRYSIGTGKFNKTPAVEFEIVDKITQPAWWKDGKVIEFGDPQNVLGTRWMKIESKEHPEIKGYGIHGTWEPDSIGKQSSAGCVRMLNADVEELFDLVPRQTKVAIVE